MKITTKKLFAISGIGLALSVIAGFASYEYLLAGAIGNASGRFGDVKGTDGDLAGFLISFFAGLICLVLSVTTFLFGLRSMAHKAPPDRVNI